MAVVTDIVRSGATTIVISGGSTSFVIFEAAGNVEEIDLADASIGLKVASQKNVGYVLEAKKGLIPLIALSKLQRKIPNIWEHEFTICKSIQEEKPEDLYFGRIQ